MDYQTEILRLKKIVRLLLDRNTRQNPDLRTQLLSKLCLQQLRLITHVRRLESNVDQLQRNYEHLSTVDREERDKIEKHHQQARIHIENNVRAQHLLTFELAPLTPPWST